MSKENKERIDAEDCHRCGAHNPAWHAPSPLWNAVMRGGSINGEPIFEDMVCATCFMTLAEERGIACIWRVEAQQVNVPLEATTPSGRIWDAKHCLWRDTTEQALLAALGADWRALGDIGLGPGQRLVKTAKALVVQGLVENQFSPTRAYLQWRLTASGIAARSGETAQTDSTEGKSPVVATSDETHIHPLNPPKGGKQ